VGVALLSFGWNEFVLPRANYEKEALTNRVSQQMQDKPPLEEKVNLNTFEDGFLKRLVYANKLEKDIMKEVSVIEYDQGEFSRIIFSKEAQWQNGGGWLFKDGTMYQFSGDKKSAFVMKFKKEVVNLKAQPRDISHYEKNPNDMDVFELRWFIHKELNAGKNVTGLQFLWHQRFALPFAAVVFVILGMGLGVGHIRRPSGMGIAITLMMIAVYYILNSTFDSVTRQGILSPFLGAWLANGVLLAYGIHLLREKSMGFK
jgi:lipopolysaccharide export system permease protein